MRDTKALSVETFAAIRAASAIGACERASDRRESMLANVPRVASMESAERIADSIMRDTDRAASGKGEGLRTGAASAIRAELADRGVATRYAQDSRQNGAIPSQRVKVRSGSPDRGPSAGAPVAAQDVVLARGEQAARVACMDLRAMIPAFHTSTGPRRKDLCAKIALIVRDHAGSRDVIAQAVALGWRV